MEIKKVNRNLVIKNNISIYIYKAQMELTYKRGTALSNFKKEFGERI